MAEINSSPKVEAPPSGNIDTTLPYDTVKAAVTLFGEKADFGERRAPASAEKRSALELEARRAHEDLVSVKERLAVAEKAQAQAVQDLEAAKATWLHRIKTLEETVASKDKALEVAQEGKARADKLLGEKSRELDEKRKSWESEMAKTAQLSRGAAEVETEKLKQELTQSKIAGAKEAEAQLEIATKAKKDAEQAAVVLRQEKEALAHQLSQSQGALTAAHVNLVKVGEEKSALSKEIERLATAIEADKKEIEGLKKQAELEASKAKKDTEQAEILHKQEKEAFLQQLAQAQEALVASNANVTNAEESKKALLKELEQRAAAEEAVKEELDGLKKQVADAKEFELKLVLITSAAEKLEKELMASREIEARTASDSLELKTLLNKVRADFDEMKAAKEATQLELEQTRAQLAKLQAEEASLRGAFATLQTGYDKENAELTDLNSRHSKLGHELEQTLGQLKKLQEEQMSVQAAFVSLQRDYDNEHAELVEFKVKDSRAAEEYGSLTSDLEKTIEDLSAVTAAEAKAREQVAALTEALQQVTAEADAAKKLVALSKEEAAKAKAEADRANAALSTTESRLLAAMKEVEAVKAAQMLAQSECKTLREKIGDNDGLHGEKESGDVITISREEFHALRRKTLEVEDLAKKQVDAAIAQVAAAQASEREVVTRLHAALADLDISREAAGIALKRAEKAEEAKSKIEGDLRKHRSENEQRRKGTDHSRELGIGTGTPPKNGQKNDGESKEAFLPLNHRQASREFQKTSLSRQQSGELPKQPAVHQKSGELQRTPKPGAVEKKQSESLGQHLKMPLPQEDKQGPPEVLNSPTEGVRTKRRRSLQATIRSLFAKTRGVKA